MFTKLNKDEKIALVGILKWVVSADHDDSLVGFEGFFRENNWGDFNQIYMEMDEKFEKLDEFKEFLKTINNKEAQEIIAQIAKDIMISDVIITNEEKQILDFLEEIWDIK
ncbi:MAG: hypothetical protein KAT05_05720 [Spirochaetes bacterium]|nr:hypothetical protein [Spirochaetota bacterium]